MLNELDARGQSDEKRLSEMNVTIENLNMNVSLQNRTVMGLVEDRKLLTPCQALSSIKTVSDSDGCMMPAYLHSVFLLTNY